MPHKKNFKHSKFLCIDEGLKNYYNYCIQNNIRPTDDQLKQRALDLCKEMGIKDEFRASNGYLYKFKERCNLLRRNCRTRPLPSLLPSQTVKYSETAENRSITAISTASSIPINTTTIHTTTHDSSVLQLEQTSLSLSLVSTDIFNFNDYIHLMDPKDIYNGDEFSIYWRLNSYKKFENEEIHQMLEQSPEEKLLIFSCANLLGEKIKLSLINSQSDYKNVAQIKKLPINYYEDERSLMTHEIFTQIMIDINSMMIQQTRHIVLFVDKSKAHLQQIELSNITLVYLPDYLNSSTSSMIRLMKSIYRLKLARKISILNELNSSTTIMNMNLFQAVEMLSSSWADLNDKSISSCFRNSFRDGLKLNEIEINQNQMFIDHELNRLSDDFSRYCQTNKLSDYLEIDEKLPVCEQDEIENSLNELVLQQQTPSSPCLDRSLGIKLIDELKMFVMQSSSSVFIDKALSHLNGVEKLIYDEY